MRIKFFGARPYEVPVAQAFAEREGIFVDFCKENLSLAAISSLAGFDGVTAMEIARVDPEIFPALAKIGIKQIAQRTAGFDMYDLVAAKNAGIIISNIPSYSPETIAEYAVAGALSLIRHFPAISKRVAAQNFTWEQSIMSRPVKNMTVAIIGTGRIGALTGQIFSGFGARILGFDLYPNKNLHFLRYEDSIEAAVRDADIVSLHMPGSAENHHIFDAKMLAHFKPGAILVNAARGAVLDTGALLGALDSGHIAGAVIDTYEFEGPYFTHDWRGKTLEDQNLARLLAHENVILTPHIAFFSDEAVKNLVEGGLQATMDVIKTGTTKNRLN